MADENLTLCVPRPSSGQDPNVPVLVRSPRPRCPPNHVLIKVDRFGFSANNVTYQALGEHPHFRYFDFNEAPESEVQSVSTKTHGLFPVWGFGTVVESTHPKIVEGERVYGYFAPARYLLVAVSPADVNKHAFYVPRPHLPADRRPYNQILRCAADSQYDPSPAAEDLMMLYRPLFWTSYWCEDWLHATGYRGGASRVLISSASSKTAFCLAYLIKKRIAAGELPRTTKVVGLTSKGNVRFTKELGHYDEVLEYGGFEGAGVFASKGKGAGEEERWIYVDVASNAGLNERIRAYFASPYAPRLVACIVLGLTNLSPAAPEAAAGNWSKNTFDAAPASASSPSDPSNPQSQSELEPTSQFWPRFEHFFMPEWLDVRKHQLSVAEIFRRQDKGWHALIEDAPGWVKMERVYGGEKVRSAYGEVARGGLGPERGLIWSLWDEEGVKARL